MVELFEEAIHDTVIMLPFLYLTYVLMEYLEHKSTTHMKQILIKARKFGPVIGTIFGIVPQCGFSVLASGLYMNGSITLGTLVAVFVSTSDEAIPILLSQPDQFSTLIKVIIIKIVIAILAGYLIDFLVRSHHLKKNQALQDTHKHCEEELEKHPSIFFIALMHTMKIFIFIFTVNLVLSAMIMWIGEATLSTILADGSIWQPMIAALVGFIPNCASSILLAQLYVDQILSFGALSAGLITSAGLGLLVLFRMYDNKRDIARILGILFLIASISGIVLQIFA